MSKNRNMFRMVRRDIQKNLLQYISIIIINMLAVTLLCGFISNTITLDDRVDNYFSDARLADLTVQVTSVKEGNNEYFSSLLNNGKIEDYEYRFYAEGSIGKANGKIYFGENSISSPIISDGETGVLVDIGLKGDDGFKIGDKIDVNIAGFPTLQFIISGYMYFTEVSTSTMHAVYINRDIFSAELYAKTGVPMPAEVLYNQVLIKTNDITRIRDEINDYFSATGEKNLVYVFSRSDIESIATLQGEVKTSLRMIYIFPIIFLLVSVLVVMTTLSALILRERTNIGTLKAIGYTNARIRIHYSSFGAVLCLIGGILGVIISPYIVPSVMQIKYNLVYDLPPSNGIVFPFLWCIAAVLLTVVLAILIGIYVCSSVIKETPAQCCRPAPPAFIKIFTKEKKPKARKKNLSLAMAMRNIIIKPTRAFMTVVGVTGCTALLVCAFGIGDTVNNSVNLELGEQFKYDVSSTYTTAKEESFLALMEEMKNEGKIEDYQTFKTFFMTVTNKNSVKSVLIYKIEENSPFTTINPNGGAVISKSIADQMNIKIGDTVTANSSFGTYEIKITDITQTAVTKGIFISSDILDNNYHTGQIWIFAKDTASLTEIIKSNNGTGDVVNMTEFHDSVTQAISSIDTIKATMMLFSIALSAVVLYNLSLLNAKERTRDIATLKVLGFSNHEVSLSLFYEVMILVFIGTFCGLFLGFPILYLVLSINEIELISFIYYIKPVSYLYAALMSLMTPTVTSFVFSIFLRRVRLTSSLKSVE